MISAQKAREVALKNTASEKLKPKIQEAIIKAMNNGKLKAVVVLGSSLSDIEPLINELKRLGYQVEIENDQLTNYLVIKF